MKNWILVKNQKGEDIKVRQSRAYGEIFMEMYRDHLAKNDGRKSEDDLLNKTKYLVNQLWQQHQDFISDKKVFNIPVK